MESMEEEEGIEGILRMGKRPLFQRSGLEMEKYVVSSLPFKRVVHNFNLFRSLYSNTHRFPQLATQFSK
jgi:hypothetical protein